MNKHNVMWPSCSSCFFGLVSFALLKSSSQLKQEAITIGNTTSRATKTRQADPSNAGTPWDSEGCLKKKKKIRLRRELTDEEVENKKYKRGE